MFRVRLLLLSGLLMVVLGIGVAGCRSAHTTSAILYIDEQNYQKAVDVIHEGFEYQDDEPDAYYYLGEAYSHLAEEAVENDEFTEAKKNYELAYTAYKRAIEIDKKGFEEEVNNSLHYNYSNRLRQAQLDWQENYYEQAEGHLRLAYAALPDSLRPMKDLARMKMQISQEVSTETERVELLNEALELLDQVLAANPEAYELNLNKANVLAALGRNEEAGRIFDTLLADHGDDTGLLMDIANLAIDNGDYARAGDFYVRIVDLNETDTDAANDDQNKAMLVSAGTWYSTPNIGRYDDALEVLDRAADMELIPTENTILMRLRTYYNYGKKLKDDSAATTDPAQKQALEEKSRSMFDRAVEIGVAMTNNFVANPDGFFYLSLSQMEVGDYTASDANFKTYQELSEATP